MEIHQDSDPVALAQERPQFFDTPGLDRLFAVCMALAEQLATANERFDTLLEVLAQKDVLTPEELSAYIPDETSLRAREERQQDLVKRILAVIDTELADLEAQGHS